MGCRSSQGWCDGRSVARTQGAPIAEAIGATEDAATGRPSRPCGNLYPAKPSTRAAGRARPSSRRRPARRRAPRAPPRAAGDASRSVRPAAARGCASSSSSDGAYAVARSPPIPITVTLRVQMSRFGLTSTGPRSTKAPDSTTTPPGRASAAPSGTSPGRRSSRGRRRRRAAVCSRTRPTSSSGSSSEASSTSVAPRSAATSSREPEPVDRDQLAAADEARLEQVAEPERADAVDHDALAERHVEHAPCSLDAVRHRHRLGQHGELVRQLVGDAEERRAGQQVHVAPPSRRRGAGGRATVEAVAVVLESLAEVVGLAVEAVPAAAARRRSRRARSGRRRGAACRRRRRTSPPIAATTPTFSCPQISG